MAESGTDAMILWAVGLVAFAAVFHASWNIFLQSQSDPLWVSRRAVIASAAVWTPLVAVAWFLTGRPGMPSRGWLLVAASGVLEVAYFYFLSAAYRKGTLSEVYSVARGSAPVLAVLGGIVVLGEHLTAGEAVGVGLLIAGIWVARRPGPPSAALLPALVTGLMIAAYSTVDSAGVHLAQPWLYGYLVWVATAVFLFLATSILRNRETPAPTPTTGEPGAVGAGVSRSPSSWSQTSPSHEWFRGAVVGMLMTVTYLMILFALRLAPLAVVSPLRESAIVLVALWSLRGQSLGPSEWIRLAGAASIAAGATLVAVF